MGARGCVSAIRRRRRFFRFVVRRVSPTLPVVWRSRVEAAVAPRVADDATADVKGSLHLRTCSHALRPYGWHVDRSSELVEMFFLPASALLQLQPELSQL